MSVQAKRSQMVNSEITDAVPVVLTHPKAILPKQAAGDIGFDVHAVEYSTIPAGSTRCIKTGIRLADEMQHKGQHRGFLKTVAFLKVEGRSGLAARGIFPVGGIIDPSYRGDIGVVLHNSSHDHFNVNEGDRIAQLVIYQAYATDDNCCTIFEEQIEQKKTARGEKGFGSSGR